MKGSETVQARRRLRLGIAAFVLAVAIPSALLVLKALDQIKWESLHQQQLSAEEFTTRIDQSLSALVRMEDGRPVSDYDFFIGRPGSEAAYGRRSPLSELDARDGIPGLLGWFQVTADGGFNTPLLPAWSPSASSLGFTQEELARRQAQADRIKSILIGNRLVERRERPSPVIAATEPQPRSSASSLDNLDGVSADVERPGVGHIASADLAEERTAGTAAPARPTITLNERLSQAAFERLSKEASSPERSPKSNPDWNRKDIELETAKTEGLAKGGSSGTATPASAAPTRFAYQRPSDRQRQDQSASAAEGTGRSVRLFESSVEPCEVGRLDSGHFLIFRSVWREGTRLIQGALIEQAPFLDHLVGGPFLNAALARTSHVEVVYRGDALANFEATAQRDYRDTAPPGPSTLIYRTRMQEPFGGLELVFTAHSLPIPAGATVIAWMADALALVLLGGAWLMYRLGLSQIALVRQQQDFVSAVSHELKTPLTSIRLYAEMLRAGFASEERKAVYYRFIHEESERLSRLIANVLQLARIGRDSLVLESRPVSMPELLAALEERMGEQVERAGFALELACAEPIWIQADPDAVIQILINLVDNALKFCGDAEQRVIRIGCEASGEGRLGISVRDFGPGIPREQRRQLFRLFYRGEDAKRRAIPGTGIGLALVKHLTVAMGGSVDVLSRDPGTELRVELPMVEHPDDANSFARSLPKT